MQKNLVKLFTQLNRRVRYGTRSAVERLRYLPERSRAPLSDAHAKVIHDLNTEGVHVTSVERLFGQAGAAYRSAAAFVTDPTHKNNASYWRAGLSSRDVAPAALLSHLPGVYLAGLDADVLALVGRYIGKSVAYHGSVVRHSAVNGGAVGTRLWHQDGEDANVFRMVVYLNDVEPGGGPFEYIPRSTGLSYRQLGSGELTNERMQAVMPKDRWKQVYGPAGTVVLCDTARVFHHESIQESRPRSVVMIGYSSRFPKSMTLSMAHFPVEQVFDAVSAVTPADRFEHAVGWRRPDVASEEQRREHIEQSRARLKKAA